MAARAFPGAPDGVHLHMLIYKRLVRWAIGSREMRHQTQRNSMTSPYLWLLSSLAVIPAVLFWQQPYILMLFTAVFSATYIVLYRKLVLFRMPKWMIVKSASAIDIGGIPLTARPSSARRPRIAIPANVVVQCGLR